MMEENGTNPRQVVNRMGLAMFIMAVATIGAQIIIQACVTAYAPRLAGMHWYALALTAVTVAGIGLPVVYFASKWVPAPEKRSVVKLGAPKFFAIFFISVAAMYLANYFGYFIGFIITILKGGKIINPIENVILDSNIVITILYGAIFGPIVEELIFRKILLGKLRRLGELPAILLSGLAFGLFHMNLYQFFYATLLGFIFAYVTLKTNTIKYSILLHIMINSIGTILAPLAVKTQNLAWVTVMGVWVICSITLGLVFFLLNVKKIRLEKAEEPIDKKSAYFLNTGVILYSAVCLYMTVLQIMRPV